MINVFYNMKFDKIDLFCVMLYILYYDSILCNYKNTNVLKMARILYVFGDCDMFKIY